jgi:hypothetical protein
MGGTAFELSVEFAGVYSVSRAAAIAGSSGASRACEKLFGLPLNPPGGDGRDRSAPGFRKLAEPAQRRIEAIEEPRKPGRPRREESKAE